MKKIIAAVLFVLSIPIAGQCAISEVWNGTDWIPLVATGSFISQSTAPKSEVFNVSSGTLGGATITGTLNVGGSSVSATGNNYRISAATVTIPGILISNNAVTAWATYVATSAQTLDSVGISSVSRTGTGIYKITLQNPFANILYPVVCMPQVNLAITHIVCEEDAYTSTAKTTTQFGCRCVSMPGNTETDPWRLNIWVAGRQP